MLADRDYNNPLDQGCDECDGHDENCPIQCEQGEDEEYREVEWWIIDRAWEDE